jgi:hypothetical protein
MLVMAHLVFLQAEMASIIAAEKKWKRRTP